MRTTISKNSSGPTVLSVSDGPSTLRAPREPVIRNFFKATFTRYGQLKSTFLAHANPDPDTTIGKIGAAGDTVIDKVFGGIAALTVQGNEAVSPSRPERIPATHFFRNMPNRREDLRTFAGMLQRMGSHNFMHNIERAENHPGFAHASELEELRHEVEDLAYHEDYDQAARVLKDWNDRVNQRNNTVMQIVSSEKSSPKR